MKLKNISVLILCILAVFMLLSSCGKETTEEQASTVPVDLNDKTPVTEETEPTSPYQYYE